jgi:hypothetical protein
MDKIKLAADLFLKGKGTLNQIKRKLKIQNNNEIVKEINNRGYYMKAGYSYSTVINIKYAVDQYIKNYLNKPSLTKIVKKYNVDLKAVSNIIKSLNYKIINYQNRVKFDNHVFDNIDTEEKAYWLGFIFADGYISKYNKNKKHNYCFEISLKESDKEHLDKFNKFMKHEDINHVKTNISKCKEKEFKRCRWAISDKHLWKILNSYGCVPSKSLILKFPNVAIFNSKKLIKHFIRGYLDGDGCISWCNKKHTKTCVSILGTKEFLIKLQDNLPLKYNYILHNNNKNNNITKVFSICGKNAFTILYYLYNDAKIYLNRKYQRYKENCRLYKELYKLLQTKNGKIVVDNSVLNSEIKKSESM